MNAQMHVGKPEMTVSEEQSLTCLPDVNACPRGWTLQGPVCTSTSYQGSGQNSCSFLLLVLVPKTLSCCVLR